MKRKIFTIRREIRANTRIIININALRRGSVWKKLSTDL